jgi:hypothetical protein
MPFARTQIPRAGRLDDGGACEGAVLDVVEISMERLTRRFCLEMDAAVLEEGAPESFNRRDIGGVPRVEAAEAVLNRVIAALYGQLLGCGDQVAPLPIRSGIRHASLIESVLVVIKNHGVGSHRHAMHLAGIRAADHLVLVDEPIRETAPLYFTLCEVLVERRGKAAIGIRTGESVVALDDVRNPA